MPTKGKNIQEPRRINIYVPAELKTLMDARPDVNWSRVAQNAFVIFLAQHNDLINEYGPFIKER